MNKNVTLEIPQSEWKKFNEELARIVTVMQEQERESDERWARIADLRVETSQLRESRQQARTDVEALLGSADLEWMTQREIWREEKLQHDLENECLKTENERLRLEIELERQRRLLPPASSQAEFDQSPPKILSEDPE